jgi:hypothetical protein
MKLQRRKRATAPAAVLEVQLFFEDGIVNGPPKAGLNWGGIRIVARDLKDPIAEELNANLRFFIEFGVDALINTIEKLLLIRGHVVCIT